jgi:hypothetical protein
MIIVDRTFGNLHGVADTKFYGKVAVALFKFATMGKWRAKSDYNLVSQERDYKYGCLHEKCYKVVTCDKNDEIIDMHASLISCAAKIWCESKGNAKLLSNKEILQLLNAVKSILQAEEVLHRFLILRVSKEIERDTISTPRSQNNHHLDYVQKTRTSKSESGMKGREIVNSK